MSDWTAHLHAVILAGGSGTRLWPLSHRRLPKQFLAVGGERSLLSLTLSRLTGLVPPERSWMVGSASHAELAEPHLPGVPASQILREPEAKNTAPALAFAAAVLAARDPRAVMAVFPADHFIEPADEAEFRRLLDAAAQLAWERGGLVTLGIRPTAPATGYGYIEAGDEVRIGQRTGFKARRFKEKPDLETARGYLASGRYYWNSGIFVWKAATFLEQLRLHHPEMAAAFSGLGDHWGAPDFPERIARAFAVAPSISVDYAVMEKAQDVWMIPAEIGWNDVGSLDSFKRLLPADPQGNHSHGELLALDAGGNLVLASKPVALVGVSGLALVETDRALLVVPLDRVQEVKDVVQLIKDQGKEDLL